MASFERPRCGLQDLGWALFCLSIPFTAVHFPDFGFIPLAGLSSLPATMVPAAILACWCLAHRIRDSAQWRFTWGPGLFLGVFTAWALLAGACQAGWGHQEAVAGHSSLMQWVRGSFALAVGVSFYAVARCLLADGGRRSLTRRFLYIGGAATVLLACLQSLSMTALPWIQGPVWLVTEWTVKSPHANMGEWYGRPYGFASEPSWMAAQLALLVIPLALTEMSLVLAEVRGWRRAVCSAESWILLVAVGGIVISGSRAGLVMSVALVAVWILSLITVLRARRLAIVLAFTSLLGLACVIACGPQFMRSTIRTMFDQQQTASGKIATLGDDRFWGKTAAVQVFSRHAAIGTGLGQYGFGVVDSVPAQDLVRINRNGGDGYVQNPLDMTLKIAAELGIVGLILWFCFLLPHFRITGRGDPKRTIYRNLAITGLVCYWLIIDSFAHPAPWLVLALLASPPADVGATDRPVA